MERLVALQQAQTCNKIIEMTDEIRDFSPPPPRLTVARVGPISIACFDRNNRREMEFREGKEKWKG